MTEIEIPLYGLDNVILSSATGVELVNQSPAPGEQTKQLSPTIEFDLIDFDGVAIVRSNVTIYVNGVLAFNGTSYQAGNGFTGSDSAVGTNGHHFAINDLNSYSSEAVIEVNVVYGALDEKYTFTLSDFLGPVTTAESEAKDVVVFTFDETVVDDGFDVVFTRLTAPAVNIEMESYTFGTNTIEVVLTEAMTPGATYQAVVSGLTDESANAPSVDTVEFTGFQPDKPAFRDLVHYQLLAETDRTRDVTLELQAFSACIQEVIELALCSIDEFTQIFDPDLASEPFLDAILDDLGNPFDFDLTVDQKRQLVQILVGIYKLKGTATGIISAVRFFLGVEITVTQALAIGWDLGVDEIGDGIEEDAIILGSESITLANTIEISSVESLTTTQIDQILEIAEYMKPAEVHARYV